MAVSSEVISGSWLDNALTALRQRLCPNHFRPLAASGWCLWCRAWYSADFVQQELIARYPMPALGVDPET
jgi:hypothetical protein